MLIRTEGLKKSFTSGWFAKSRVNAVKHANIHIGEGETVGVLGESGSGKSTLGLMVAGLVKPTEGSLAYKDKPVSYPFRGSLRREIQILFQHPEISFNPKLTLGRSFREIYGLYGIPLADRRLEKHIENFGLYEEHLRRYPSQLSGGELQRAALARVLVIKPRLIVLDEPTSMLDVISQAQMVELLKKVQAQEEISYLYITHHVKLAEMICARIYKMDKGETADYKKIDEGDVQNEE